MISKHVPADGLVVKRGKAEIALGVSLRAWDESGHKLVVVNFPGRGLFYGEWLETFEDNGVDFSITISTFGYLDGDLAGVPELGARSMFSDLERKEVEALIRALFAEAAVARRTMPFLSKVARYSGAVAFAPGWIRLR